MSGSEKIDLIYDYIKKLIYGSGGCFMFYNSIYEDDGMNIIECIMRECEDIKNIIVYFKEKYDDLGIDRVNLKNVMFFILGLLENIVVIDDLSDEIKINKSIIKMIKLMCYFLIFNIIFLL